MKNSTNILPVFSKLHYKLDDKQNVFLMEKITHYKEKNLGNKNILKEYK